MRQYLVACALFHDDNGELLGFAKITRDMTERRRLEELERASAASALVQQARENEQKRIARELHDALGQQITALKMTLAVLRIHDDGVGLPADSTPRSDSFGLLGMRERISQLGGVLSVESSPGRSVTITARVPLSRITVESRL